MQATHRRLAAGGIGRRRGRTAVRGRRHPADADGDGALDRRAVGPGDRGDRGAAAIGRRYAARNATGGTRIQRRRCRRIPAADGARRARQPRREFRRCRDRVSRRLRLAAEGSRPRQPGYRHRIDAPGIAGVRSGPFRRGRCVVQAGGRIGAARQRQGSGRASAALPGAARTEPGTRPAGVDPARPGGDWLCRRSSRAKA